MGLPAADILQPFIMSSIFGCTLEPINKRPVTNTMISLAGMADCNSSAHGGPHTTSNFRSDHPGGAQFLLLDGSIRFTDDSIDLTTYRRLSTIAEGVPAPFP
jgi:prepilin-type processing-associated H-X9-DG protein